MSLELKLACICLVLTSTGVMLIGLAVWRLITIDMLRKDDLIHALRQSNETMRKILKLPD